MSENLIETDRLYLKASKITDAEFFLKLYNEPQFIENIGNRNLKTSKDAENYISNRFLPQIEKLGFGNYVMIRKTDGKKVGAIGVFAREGIEFPDIGFSVLKEFHQKGYAFEAAEQLIKFLTLNFKITKYSAMTSSENIASQNLIKKLGLKFVKMVEFPDDGEILQYYEN